MRCGPFIVQNIHLFNAFTLRKEGRYQEAFAEVEMGCKENDSESLLCMYYIYVYGGFGVKKNDEKRLQYRSKYYLISNSKFQNGNPFAGIEYLQIHPFFEKGEEFSKNIIEYAKWGDAAACFLVYKFGLIKESEEYILKCAKQMFCRSFLFIANLYERKKDFVNCAKYAVLNNQSSITVETERIKRLIKLQNLQALYIYGKAITKGKYKYNLSEHFKFVPSRIYLSTRETVYRTIMNWLLVCKYIGLYRDIAQFIARVLYTSKKYPEEWGIKMWEERKLRKRINNGGAI